MFIPYLLQYFSDFLVNDNMSNDYFNFKQFSIHQRRAAMKVGTDGVLLGCLAQGGERILDIGTGTGIISLMMAQRFPEACFTAVEIDDNAYLDAEENFAASPFADRISLVKAAFQDYAKTCGVTYDCIVSNPPYFDESLENPDEGRTRARHTSSLPFRDLIGGAYQLLEEGGVFSVCIPPEVLKKFSAECLITGFSLLHCYGIKSVPRKPYPKRYVLVYQKGYVAEPQQDVYCMQNADGSRSDWYIELMKDFYL